MPVTLLRVLALALLALSAAPAALAADTYPDRPVRFIVGAPPGSGMDLATRIVTERMRDELRQPMVVENRPGADGAIAARTVATAPPDGYTLLPSTGSQMTVNPALQKDLPYDPLRAFEPIGFYARVPLVLVVNPSVPATTVRELVAYAKANPDALNYGTGGSVFMLAAEQLKKLTGMPMRHIPFNGVPPSVSATVAGDVQVSIANVAPSLGHIKAGKLRALALLGPARDPLLPDVPTIAEAGVKGFDIDVWLGLFAPAGTPPDVTQRLAAALARAVQAPETREKLAAAGSVPLAGSGPELARLVRRELAEYDALARDIGIAANPTPRAYPKWPGCRRAMSRARTRLRARCAAIRCCAPGPSPARSARTIARWSAIARFALSVCGTAIARRRWCRSRARATTSHTPGSPLASTSARWNAVSASSAAGVSPAATAAACADTMAPSVRASAAPSARAATRCSTAPSTAARTNSASSMRASDRRAT
ncbi:MAG: tripartite tricarboxylate transporter substrate binding protein [Burkholderiales bacterium]